MTVGLLTCKLASQPASLEQDEVMQKLVWLGTPRWKGTVGVCSLVGRLFFRTLMWCRRFATIQHRARGSGSVTRRLHDYWSEVAAWQFGQGLPPAELQNLCLHLLRSQQSVDRMAENFWGFLFRLQCVRSHSFVGLLLPNALQVLRGSAPKWSDCIGITGGQGLRPRKRQLQPIK